MQNKKLKTSPSQARARDKWDASNKENKLKRSYKSGCKNFILKFADEEDLKIVEIWIRERREELK